MNFDAELFDIFDEVDTPMTPELLAKLEEFANFVYNEGYKDGVFDGRNDLTD